MTTTTATTDWNTRWAFAREQAHTEHATSTQKTIRTRLASMRQTAAITPSSTKTPEFSGYAVGLADLLKD